MYIVACCCILYLSLGFILQDSHLHFGQADDVMLLVVYFFLVDCFYLQTLVDVCIISLMSQICWF